MQTNLIEEICKMDNLNESKICDYCSKNITGDYFAKRVTQKIYDYMCPECFTYKNNRETIMKTHDFDIEKEFNYEN